MFLVAHPVYDGINIGTVHAQHVRRHLPMQNLGRDVGAIGRHLAPPGRAVFGRDPYKADKFGGKGFDRVQFHGAAQKN